MPVWHELTKPWRESGQLVVLGLAQEQHPERCRLFAQWKGFDWPILWDPFHLTGSPAVPNIFALDEHGIVRAIGPSPEWLRDEFIERTFEASDDAPAAWPVTPGVGALGRLLFAEDAAARDALLDEALLELRQVAADHPLDGAALFRLGVGHRMRFDGTSRRAGDFQAALDAWAAALATDPNVYIWRRRIQQYGPRMDKPYPFYTWVDEATQALIAEGGVAPAWTQQLTAAERAQPRRSLESPSVGETAPDPSGAIHRASAAFEIATAVAWDSYARAPLARVHLELRPVPGSGVHWNNEADPLQVWLGDPGLPDGWVVERRLLRHDVTPAAAAHGSQGAAESGSARTPHGDTPHSEVPAISDESRRLEFEIRLPEGATGSQQLTGYALFNACSDTDGTCVYRRLDFEVPLTPPAR